MKAPQPQPSPATRRRPRKTPDPDTLGPAYNFSKMPNDYALLLAGHKLAGTLQRDIVFCILHHTWGAYPQKGKARLSTRQIAKYCGDEGSSNVVRMAADLKRRGIIEIEESAGCSRTAKNYWLTPELWKDAPAYEPSKLQSASAVLPEDEEEESQDDPAFPAARNCSKLLLRPGCKPRPMAARLTPKDKDPVDFRIECSNTGFDPVEFSASTEADVLRISFQSRRRKSEPAKPAEGENKANEQRKTAIPQSHQFTVSSPTVVENKRSSEFQLAVKTLLAEEFSKSYNPDLPEDQKFLQSILENAHPDLTAADYQFYCRQELRKMRKRPGSGILKSFASQAAVLPRPSEPLPSPAALTPDETPASATEPELASVEDISAALDLCVFCHGRGEVYSHGDKSRCGACRGTGKKPNAGGRPC